jgi:hypothetical protein
MPAFSTRLRSSLMVLLGSACFAQMAEAPLPSDPSELVRKAVQNEIKAAQDDQERFLFRSTKTTPKGSVTKIYVETREATAGLVVAYNGKPLTPEQRRAEEARVQRFLNDPDELRKKRNQEREDAERTTRIVRALPDAFLFEYAGEEKPSEGGGAAGHALVKLTFKPNPRYQPPSRVEQVLTGMQGFLLLDAERPRIALIDGTLFRDVSFGWGILGHLDRGGHFQVEQQQIEDDTWEISRMSLKFTGKILLIKNLTIDSTEVFSGFKRVPPNLTFAQALELLRIEETTSQNGVTQSRGLAGWRKVVRPSLPAAFLPAP